VSSYPFSGLEDRGDTGGEDWPLAMFFHGDLHGASNGGRKRAIPHRQHDSLPSSDSVRTLPWRPIEGLTSSDVDGLSRAGELTSP